MPSIGEQLKQAREARKLTIKQAVEATRIRPYYLEALESDDLSAIPSLVQARGFLRSYAEFLGIPLADLSDDLPVVEQPPASPTALTAPQTDSPLRQESTAAPQTSPVPPAPVEPEPEPPSGPPPPSQVIFREIGHQLRERRELISLTLEEIERHTRIRRHHLEKIETGDFDDLPSPVQARGLVHAYANFLDLDAEALLLRFADALQARRMERQPQPAQRKRRAPLLPLWFRHFLSADLIFGGSMVLLLLGMAIWGAARLFSKNSISAEPTATEGPSISEVLLAPQPGAETPTLELAATSISELGTVIPTDAPPEFLPPTATPFIEFAPSPGLQVTVLVIERTYLKVIVDGEVKQEGRVVPGAALKFEGQARIEVLTGSGAAVQIMYNQQNLGVMGSFGEVVNRIYTLNGIETPTPTPSPTPTVTPPQSPTPSPTLTPPVTSTPLP